MNTASEGSKINISRGFAMAGRRAAVTTTSVHWIQLIENSGSCSSILPMSLEKRFKILPVGIVSKNNRLAYNRALTILLCSCCEALSDARKKRKTRMAISTSDAATALV